LASTTAATFAAKISAFEESTPSISCTLSGVLLMFAIFAALDRFFLGGFVGRGGFIVSLLLTDFKFNASAFIVALSFSAVVGAS
jgi:hypothetical protein